MPIELVVNEHHEKESYDVIYSKDEAMEIGVENLKKQLKEQIKDEDNISNIYINTYEGEQYIEVEVIYEVLESIGTKEKILN